MLAPHHDVGCGTMLTRKLLWTTALTVTYAILAVGADFLLNVVVQKTPQLFSPVESAALAILIGAPATYYLISQRLDLKRAVAERDQSAQDLAIAADRAEAAAKAKADFLANMSHELRTPLNAIIGFTGVLASSTTLGAPERRHVSLIGDASATLLTIVNGVLDFSRLESGGFELDPHPFDPEALATSVAAMVGDQAQARGLELTVAGRGGNETLVGDAPRLRQVLLNLVGNALKFTAEGRIAVVVEQSPTTNGRRRLRMSVDDTGIGIAEGQLASIFERFSQADVSVTRRFGGTGLGLAICKRLVELMGGVIHVESREGRGSRFWFDVELPVALDLGVAEPYGASEPLTLERSVRLLLVEDVPVNRELVRTILEPFDIEVDTAEDGAQAVEAVARAAYDLVLMDVQMPVMDGLTATRAIRARGGRLARLPILAMTANVLPEQIQQCREAGMDGHLGKPIEPRALLEAISLWSQSGGSDDPAAWAAETG